MRPGVASTIFIRKIRFVFAFVVRRAGDARGVVGGRVGACHVPEPAPKFLGCLGTGEAGYPSPCLMIAGAGPQRQEASPTRLSFASSRSSSCTNCTVSLYGRTMMLFWRAVAPGNSLGSEFLAVSWLLGRPPPLTLRSLDPAGPAAPIILSGAVWPREPTRASRAVLVPFRCTTFSSSDSLRSSPRPVAYS